MVDHNKNSLLRGVTAIVVDDDGSMRELLRNVLVAIGLRVVGEGNTGHRAIDLFQKLSPEVICLDIEMPEMSGLEALAKIRALNGNAIVLMITASPTGENVRQAIAGGASGIIAKPFSSGKVVSEIKRAVIRARAANGQTSSADEAGN